MEQNRKPERKPGWNYFFCQSLNQQIAINEKTDVLYTEDKTRYSPQECHLLKSIDYNIPLCVHLVKQVFNGEIVSL